MSKVLTLPKLPAVRCSHCKSRIYYLLIDSDDALLIGQAIEIEFICPRCSECVYSVIVKLDKDESLVVDAVKFFPD